MAVALQHTPLHGLGRAAELKERFAVEERLVTLVVRVRVDARVHTDGVTRARFNAESAHDAPELVDHERRWVLRQSDELLNYHHSFCVYDESNPFRLQLRCALN